MNQRSRWLSFDPFKVDRSYTYLLGILVIIAQVSVSRIALCVPSVSELDHDSSAYSLTQALEDLVSKHPDVERARAEVRADQAGLRAAKQLLSPSLMATVNGGERLVTVPNPLMNGALLGIENQNYQLELQMSQPLRWGTALNLTWTQSYIDTDNPFQSCVPGIASAICHEARLSLGVVQPLMRGAGIAVNLNAKAVAQASLTATQARRISALTNLVEQLLRAYATLAFDQAQEKIELADLQLLEQQLKEAKIRVSEGMVAPADLSTITLSKAQRARTLSDRKRRINEGIATLRLLTGSKTFTSKLPQLDLPSLRIAPGTEPNWDEHPSMIALKASVRGAELRRVPLEDQARPQLDLGLIWSQSGIAEEFNASLSALPDNRSHFYGVTLTYQQGLGSAAEDQVKQAHWNVEASRASLQAEKIRLESEWQIAEAAWTQLDEAQQWAEEALSAAKASWQAAVLRFENGRGTRFEVLELQAKYTQAKFGLIQVEYERFLNTVVALRTRGTLLSELGITLTQ